MKLRRGDTVAVLSGKDRGKQGKITRTFPADDRVVVEGVRVVKKHQKPAGQGVRGGLVELTLPIPVAKVMIVCPSCEKPTRVGYRIEADQKIRICKRCGEEIPRG